ncbi:hypothetical protein BDW02DRAFT_617360 [Decorospora gaudefroyi]|uniref:Uncharacterized protein n=1 Tax=Decorospora gaudefroyi TaxID=184978 RepID=A0A6A5K207_9PLEO|nr:hypothetical protein BDW02DRAFT_617360 [Decorospora gaudefroyi]
MESRIPSPNPIPGSPSAWPSTPSPLPSLSPLTTAFDLSRMSIPPTAYASTYAPAYEEPRSFPPAGHMPSLAPQQPSPPPTPDSITYRRIFDRVHGLLRGNLPEWWERNPEALHHLTARLAHVIIRHGQAGRFGPDGLGSLSEIFICIGHEDIKHYMCLAINAHWGNVVVILKGELCEKDGKDPMHDDALMELAKTGFDKEAARLYTGIAAEGLRR